MSNYGTNEYVFDISINTENEMARFYTGLMIKFENHDSRDFFKEMARDEIYHMKRLIKIKNSLNNRQLSSPADSNLLEEAELVKKFNVLDSLETIETLKEAYIAIKGLESSEVNAVYTSLLLEFVDSE